MPSKLNEGIKVIASNRRARHDYELSDTYEAGLVLVGSEVKSLRAHSCSLTDGFVQERDGELWLMEVNIADYGFYAAGAGHAPRRPRKLLMHKKEIAKLISKMREKGYTVVPTQMYFKEGRAKVEIALARGRRSYDKRDVISERDNKRTLARVLKERDH